MYRFSQLTTHQFQRHVLCIPAAATELSCEIESRSRLFCAGPRKLVFPGGGPVGQNTSRQKFHIQASWAHYQSLAVTGSSIYCLLWQIIFSWSELALGQLLTSCHQTYSQPWSYLVCLVFAANIMGLTWWQSFYSYKKEEEYQEERLGLAASGFYRWCSMSVRLWQRRQSNKTPSWSKNLWSDLERNYMISDRINK